MARFAQYLRKARDCVGYGRAFATLQLLGRIHVFRSIIRRLRRATLPPARLDPAAQSTLLSAMDIDDTAATMRRDGLCSLRLRPEIALRLREALLARECHGAGQRHFAFHYEDRAAAEDHHGRQFLQAHYYELESVDPLFQHIARDAMLLDLARRYFGSEPVWAGTRAWWSFARDASDEQRRNVGQAFHYDVDDYLAMSVFFYLTDVDHEGGPHVAVLGSHGAKRLFDILRPGRTRTDAEIRERYPPERVVTLCGPAGTGFAEDTFCFHKALHPIRHDRLILQIRFAMHDFQVGTDSAHRAMLANALR